jgi:tripartite-type tricarboxylate transporter receptor subunit TctC
LYVWHTVGVKSIEDLKNRETILAADGTVVNIISDLLKMTTGARFKLILGYRGTREVHLALERGEVEGAVSSVNTLRLIGGDLLKKKMVNVIVQNAFERQSALPDVPTTVELGKTPEDKEVLAFFASSGVIGRSIAGAPGIPPERLRVLRDAFDAMMKDTQFLGDAAQSQTELGLLAGIELQKASARTINIGPAERERVRSIRWHQ